MSTAKPMTTADRQAHYVKQNGRVSLTARQAQRIKKAELRLEHGRHRRPSTPSAERARPGRKRLFADWQRNAYRMWLQRARRQNRRARLGRFTPGRNR